MKSINKLAMTVALALSSAGAAFATTINVIHVTGSTAFRAADVTAETAWLNSLGGTGGVTAEYFDTSSGSLTHASASVVYGPVVSGVQYVFENLFNGSIGGDEALVGPVALNFPKASAYSGTASTVTVGSSSNGVSTGGTDFNSTSGYTTESVNPDVSFSDVFFDTATQVISADDGDVNNTLGTPSDKVVGVVPFAFFASGSDSTTTGKLAGLTMTPQLFTQLYVNGHIPLSFFTGVTTDSSYTVYALGRDIDSGTRATALAETGYGLNGSGNKTVNTPVNQYYPFDNSTDYTNDTNNSSSSSPAITTGVVGIDANATTIGKLGPVPPEDVDDYEMAQGDGGYYSGGNLDTGMTSSFNGITNTVLITYLGVSDGKTVLTAGRPATLLSYNGVTFIPNPTSSQTAANAALIYSGKYTFWGYEHEFFFGSSGPVYTAATGIQTQLVTNSIDTLASAGVATASMTVGRTDDGQAITAGRAY